jgi:pyridoxal phosphate enzyme (YggS family)
VTHLDWDAPGPYRVVFSTRNGGVSEPPFATLNLGKKLGDDPDRVEENRRRLCAHASAAVERLAMNYQLHSSRVNRAEAGVKGPPGDALWTDEPGLPILAMTADCVPVALVRTRGTPAVCVVHAGRIGILGGVLDEAVRALGGGVAAAVGPAMAPAATRSGTRSRSRIGIDSGPRSSRPGDSTSGRRPRPRSSARVWSASSGSTSARPAIRSASSPTAETGPLAGARECSRLLPEAIRANYERIRQEVGPAVTVVAATKYVSVDDMQTLAEAGVEVVGENRAQDLVAKHARYAHLFRWHFIGHLQSRKAQLVSEVCELCHSLSSESAARKLTIPALLEVNLSGEATKSGVDPAEIERYLELYPDVRGLMTMPPLSDDPEASRPYFRRLRELAEAQGLRELSMGTSQDYRVAAEEGATYVRVGSVLYGR